MHRTGAGEARLVELGLKKENRMGAGKLKMWNAERGFGFIAD